MDKPGSEKSTVHYKGRHRSIMGKVSLVVGVLCVFFFLFCLFYGRVHKEAPVGSLLFLNGILAIAGAASSATARRETPFFDGYAMIGLVINIAVIVITFGLFLIGAAL
ncbi:MAG: hypothetical protein J6Y10_10270 [Lachnospiraceae bacterium]|nr:hypothetical protein [Lachnospiraceae bacterium]